MGEEREGTAPPPHGLFPSKSFPLLHVFVSFELRRARIFAPFHMAINGEVAQDTLTDSLAVKSQASLLRTTCDPAIQDVSLLTC